MSISGALTNALSGLTAASRSATVLSSNVANALNDGYGRREIELSTRTTGTYGGVQVAGVTRHVDMQVVSDLRNADSDLSFSDTVTTFRNRMEDLLGTPEDSDSLTGLVTNLENTLVSAASRPDLPERLTSVLTATQRLATGLNEASQGVQTLREQADAEINASVDRLNELFGQVQSLNNDIFKAGNSGSEVAGLQDLRQKVVDEIAQYVPIREIERPGGAVALVTPKGDFLVDGTAAKMEFTATAIITPYQTIDAGFLSGLTLNGRDMVDGTDADALGGGRLGALFAIRDTLAVDAQAQLDTVARDMIERFQQSGLDATRGPTDPGLFTDAGTAFDPADEVGISARIAVNTLVDPAQGGATWRLRDGLGTATAGSPGQSALLTSMLDVLQERRVPASPSFGTSGVTASGLSASLLSQVGNARQLSEQSMSFDAARHTELKERLLSDGVDTDDEMQRMLLVEQAYAANARVIQTVDQMINTLLELG